MQRNELERSKKHFNCLYVPSLSLSSQIYSWENFRFSKLYLICLGKVKFYEQDVLSLHYKLILHREMRKQILFDCFDMVIVYQHTPAC